MTQLERVKYKINRDGFITRNECLRVRPAITRLSAYILDLRNEGVKINAYETKDDYRYELVK